MKTIKYKKREYEITSIVPSLEAQGVVYNFYKIVSNKKVYGYTYEEYVKDGIATDIFWYKR